MTALYDLAGQYKRLAEQLADMDLDAQTVADTIEASGIVDDLSVKAQGCELVARSLEAFTPAIDDEIKRLTALKKHRATAAAGLRSYIKTNMEAAGIDKIEAPLFKLSIANNPPSVEIFDAAMIPVQFMRQPEPPPPAPDKTALARAIKAGAEVPGARLTQSTRLKVS